MSPRLAPPAAQWLRHNARQHGYSATRLLPLLTAAVGPANEHSVRDFLWSLKFAAHDAGEWDAPPVDDGADLIADLRADSEDALSQYRQVFG